MAYGPGCGQWCCCVDIDMDMVDDLYWENLLHIDYPIQPLCAKSEPTTQMCSLYIEQITYQDSCIHNKYEGDFRTKIFFRPDANHGQIIRTHDSGFWTKLNHLKLFQWRHLSQWVLYFSILAPWSSQQGLSGGQKACNSRFN